MIEKMEEAAKKVAGAAHGEGREEVTEAIGQLKGAVEELTAAQARAQAGGEGGGGWWKDGAGAGAGAEGEEGEWQTVEGRGKERVERARKEKEKYEQKQREMAMERDRVLAVQVLLDVEEGKDAGGMAKMTEGELVKEANKAMEEMKKSRAMRELEEPLTASARIVAAKKLRNGGILYEADSPATAARIRDPATAWYFEAGSLSKVVVRQRTYAVLMLNVPLDFKPADKGQREAAEEDSGMEKGSVADMFWVKPVERRSVEFQAV